MTINQLQYALMLKRKGSFRKAAEAIGISQPGLSLQIQKLEEESGIILFDRTSTPISPTSDGELFLLRAEEIITSVQSLSNFTLDLSSNFEGKITLGIIPTLAPFLIPLFIDHLQSDYPNFELDIQELLTEQVVRGVRDGSLNAGLISTPIDVHGIHSRPLFYEKFYLYASEQFNKSPKFSLDTIDYDQLWLLNEGNCFRDQINDFCNTREIRKHKPFVYRSNSIDALMRIVDSKGGMTILPELTTLSLTEDQEEQIIPIGNKAREIGIITRQIDYQNRYILKLMEYIRKNIPSVMLKKDKLEVVDPDIQMI